MSHSVPLSSRLALPQTNWLAWIICLSAGLFFFYEFFQLNLFDVINESLRQEFQIDATQLSWMSSTYLWADIIFLLPAGVILDRFSTRTVILLAMVICIVGTLGFGLTHSFAWASFFHFLSGIGNAFCFLSCVVLVSRWFPPRQRALVIGTLVTMAFIGGMMAHTPLAYLNDRVGWRAALLIDAAVGLAILFWIAFTIKDKPALSADTEEKSTDSTATPSVMQILTNRQNWLSGLYTSCLNLPIMVLAALWGASYLEVVHHLPKMSASNVISLIFVGSIIGSPLAGWVSDTLGQRKSLMVIGAIATLVVFSPLYFNWPLSQTALSALFLLIGVVTSTQVITYPFIAESNPSANVGTATGLASVIIMGGGGLGQLLFGYLMQYHATGTQYVAADFKFAMWMFPVATVIALVAIVLTRETYCKSMS